MASPFLTTVCVSEILPHGFRSYLLKEPSGNWPVSSHFILYWLTKYAEDIAASDNITSPERYYASSATLVNPGKSTIHVAQQIWNDSVSLYSNFESCDRTIISTVLLSDDLAKKYTLNIEVMTVLRRSGDPSPVSLPQAFAYDIARAENNQGTNGVQIWSVKCYFDKSLLCKLAAQG